MGGSDLALALAQRFLGFLALGDVDADAPEIEDVALSVEEGAAGPCLPADRAVGTAGANISGENGRLDR